MTGTTWISAMTTSKKRSTKWKMLAPRTTTTWQDTAQGQKSICGRLNTKYAKRSRQPERNNNPSSVSASACSRHVAFHWRLFLRFLKTLSMIIAVVRWNTGHGLYSVLLLGLVWLVFLGLIPTSSDYF